MTEFDNDIDKMFAAAANASEDTGEDDVGGKSTVKSEPKTESKSQPKQEPIVESKRVESKPEPKEESKAESKPQPKTEPVTERKPLVNESNIAAFDTGQGITENSISKILEMNDTYNKLNETEKKFVSGYFQVEEAQISISKIIYGALTANKRDLDALDKISKARKKTAADRAFYLMGLDGNSIEAIYEQVDLLTGELGQAGKVTDGNKIEVCRAIEKVISEMPDSVFNYISKLQEFTNKALKN